MIGAPNEAEFISSIQPQTPPNPVKSIFNSLLFVSSLTFAANASGSLVSLSFSNVGVDGSSTFLYSTAGDIWRATNVRTDGGPAMDAIFTITGTSGVDSSRVAFVDESQRGNNMRIRVGISSPFVTNATVFITINLVNAGTTDPYTGWSRDSTLITQFSDLDSDVGADRSDYAGVLTGQFTEVRTSDSVNPGSSLLDIVSNPTYASGYTVGIMQTPWGPQENVFDTSQAAQSPVTAAFFFDARNTINVVAGQRSNGDVGNRHIDIDMTPDFIIIPEPAAALLGGLGMLILLRRRR